MSSSSSSAFGQVQTENTAQGASVTQLQTQAVSLSGVSLNEDIGDAAVQDLLPGSIAGLQYSEHDYELPALNLGR